MNNKQAALIASAIICADKTDWRDDSSIIDMKDLAVEFESWLNDRP
jgi:hypothetical protein